MPAELRFDAMGTWAHVIVVGAPAGAADAARRRVAQLEARWSRFLPSSDVSRLNRAGGRPVLVSADTVLLVERSLWGWRGSAGRFDPTVLGPVLDAGYDRPFDELAARGAVAGGSHGLATGAAAVLVDGRLGTVALPPGVGFDPGGIGKGLAADLIVTELLAAGAAGACVNLGGDLRAEGEAPDGGPWVVAVDHPLAGTAGSRPPVATLTFDAGAVATSSPLRRAWWQGRARRHHLIDPGSGDPCRTDVASATVVTGEAWRAEVLAKAAVLAGVDGAPAVLEGASATGLVVDQHGRPHHAPGLASFLA